MRGGVLVPYARLRLDERVWIAARPGRAVRRAILDSADTSFEVRYQLG
jgi:hypothetical protein